MVASMVPLKISHVAPSPQVTEAPSIRVLSQESVYQWIKWSQAILEQFPNWRANPPNIATVLKQSSWITIVIWHMCICRGGCLQKKCFRQINKLRLTPGHIGWEYNIIMQTMSYFPTHLHPRPRPYLLSWSGVLESCRSWNWARRVYIYGKTKMWHCLADTSAVVCCVSMAARLSLSTWRRGIIWSTMVLAL